MNNVTRFFISYHVNDGRWKGLFSGHFEQYRGKHQLNYTFQESFGTVEQLLYEGESTAYDVVFLIISKDYLSLGMVKNGSLERSISDFERNGAKVVLVHAEHCEWQRYEWIIKKGLWPNQSNALSDDWGYSERLNRLVSELIRDVMAEKRETDGNNSLNEQSERKSDESKAEKKIKDLWRKNRPQGATDDDMFFFFGKLRGEYPELTVFQDSSDPWQHIHSLLIDEEKKIKEEEEKSTSASKAKTTKEKTAKKKVTKKEKPVTAGTPEEAEQMSLQGIIDVLKRWHSLSMKIRTRESFEAVKSELPPIGQIYEILRRSEGKRGARTADVINNLGSAAKDGTGLYPALLNELASPEVIADLETWLVKQTVETPGEPEDDLKTPDKKPNVFKFRSGIDIGGSEILNKIIDLAWDSNFGLYAEDADESYVNLRLEGSQKTDNIAVQIHKYGEYGTTIALAVVGPMKGVKVSEPKLNDFIDKGKITELSGYKADIPGEKAWLNGNLPVKGAREKATVYVIQKEIVDIPELWNDLEEILYLGIDNIDNPIADNGELELRDRVFEFLMTKKKWPKEFLVWEGDKHRHKTDIEIRNPKSEKIVALIELKRPRKFAIIRKGCKHIYRYLQETGIEGVKGYVVCPPTIRSGDKFEVHSVSENGEPIKMKPEGLPSYDDYSAGKVGEISQRIAGVSNDNVVDDNVPLVDRLGIEGEVNALSAVIAAKGTEPPLSIGLFGDWGSGKSFFMGKMRQRIMAIAKESGRYVDKKEESFFCRDIVQIPFNAWHYMDANLWASLVTHIFDKLAEHLAGDKKQAVEEKKKEIVKKVKSAQEMLENAKEEENEANEALEKAKGELETSEGEVENKRKSVSELTPRKMAKLVMKNPKVSAKIKGACEMVGIESLPETIGDLEKAVNDVRSTIRRAGRFWNSLGQSRKQKFVWGLLLIVITAIPAGIAWLLSAGFSGNLQRVGTIIVGGIVGLISWIRPKLKAINTGFGELEAARDAAYLEMDKSYNKETVKLREDVAFAERACDAVREKVVHAEEWLNRAKKEREDIETGKRLHDYIMERSNDSKYKNKLGIVSMIREDFKGLSELVTESQKDDTLGELRKIERIVLYIDDLDRCPSDRVVEVLQAVHLILAFKLFIVVVGVDCRWVLHALREEYSAFGGDGKFEESGGKWLTTPHNYVEKIFQIPFALEQMEDDGYRELISGLTEVTEQVKPEPRPEPGPKPEPRPEPGPKPEPRPEPEPGPKQEPRPEPPQVIEITSQINMTPDELRLEEWEIEFMKGLGDFVSSPRATKRFVNIYMLICATLTDREKLAEFKGTKDGGGDYQAVQLMLGILTGFPNQACDVLKAMKDKAEEESDIREFVRKLKKRKVRKSEPAVYRNIAKSEISETECGTWDILHGMLEDKIKKLGINTSFKPFGDWAGLVGRFSFQYGRANEHQVDEDEAADSAK